MKLAILFFCFFSGALMAQQPSQADLDKMMKDAQEQLKKYTSDTTLGNIMKDLQDRQQQVAGGVKIKSNRKDSLFPVFKTDTTSFFSSIPNSKLLSSLPIRTFNKAEMVSYLHNLNSKLTGYLQSKYKTDISTIPSSAVTQSGTSVGFWIKGEVNESVLVALKGAELQPDNDLLLNNAGGILTSCGLGVYGIPILEYVLEKQPGNNIILNNLGQAYFSLGDIKKAETFFLECVKSYNYYPDANLTLSYIYKSLGKNAAAIKYAENSLRGAWSSSADNLLSELKPDARMMDYVRHRYKQPEFFNFHKYPLLPQCKKVEDVAILEPQYVAFHSMIDQQSEKYLKLLQQAMEASRTSVPAKTDAAVKINRSPYRPFGAFGNAVVSSLHEEYKEKLLTLDSSRVIYYQKRKQLNDEYEIELQKILRRYEKMEYGDDEKKCREINELSNSYLPVFATQTEGLQQKTIDYYKNYLNDLTYWSYIASINDDAFHVDFYHMAIEFLGRLKEINTTRFMETKYDSHHFYPCIFTPPEKIKIKELEIEVPDCYLKPKIEVNLGAFVLEVSCETFKLDAGEGIIGKIEYNRSTSDVTVALGVGANFPRVFFAPLGLGMEGDLKSQLYITFDKTGTPSDLGVLWEAEIKAMAGVGPAKASIGLEEGLTAGFGSGLVMKENSQLKQAIDKTFPVQPADKQQNKSVKLYRN